MKKIILLATTLCLLLVMLIGCDADNYPNGDGLSFRATILEMHDDAVTVQTTEGMGFYHTTRVFFGTSELEDIGASVGDVVSVVFTGDILQTYPEQVFATSWSIVERNGTVLPNIPHDPIVGNPNTPTIADQYLSFVGYVEAVTFDRGNSGNGYLQLRGEAYISGIVPQIRVRLEDGITRSEITPSDLEIGQRVTVYHTIKGTAVWIGLPFSAIHATDDFVLSLFTDHRISRTTDVIQIWATLEYIGDYDEITIWHSVPSIIFTLTDGNTFNIGGMVVDVLEQTVLQRGEVYHFEFQKSGGWSADDLDADFWQNFFAEEYLRLPVGEYTIAVIGGFSLTERMMDSPSGLRAELNIQVVE